MSPEKPLQRSPERELSPEKQELLTLEQEGKYVFHGTPLDLEELEPRQAVDTKIGNDLAPAVFASTYADVAIFHAIVNKENCPQGVRSSSGARVHEDGSVELGFGITQAGLDQLTGAASGWVYVFDKSAFSKRADRDFEYVSHTPLPVARRVRVSRRDLPGRIQILKD